MGQIGSALLRGRRLVSGCGGCVGGHSELLRVDAGSDSNRGDLRVSGQSGTNCRPWMLSYPLPSRPWRRRINPNCQTAHANPNPALPGQARHIPRGKSAGNGGQQDRMAWGGPKRNLILRPVFELRTDGMPGRFRHDICPAIPLRAAQGPPGRWSHPSWGQRPAVRHCGRPSHPG